jgi:hypothetical protein
MGAIFALAPGRYAAGFGSSLNDPHLLNTIRSFGGSFWHRCETELILFTYVYQQS